MKNVSNRTILLCAIGIAALAIGANALPYLMRDYTGTELDTFAQCLADRGAVMYGAEWCPHCKNEKLRFGDSFRLIPYVECPDNPTKCTAAGVDGYPTWIFRGQDRYVGEQGLERLAEISGCILPTRTP